MFLQALDNWQHLISSTANLDALRKRLYGFARKAATASDADEEEEVSESSARISRNVLLFRSPLTMARTAITVVMNCEGC